MIDPQANAPIDSQLEEIFVKLRETPERDPRVVTQNRARFEEQLDEYLGSKEVATKLGLGFLTKKSITIKENYRMMKNNYRLAFSFTAVMVLIAIILFGGFGVTVSAAQAALPGDALYKVKTGYEQARVNFAGDAYVQAQMSMQFAEIRLSETAALIDDGRYDDISLAVAEFENYIQSASESLSELSASDPAKASELSAQISDALFRFSLILSNMVDEVPEPFMTEVQRALLVARGESSSSEDDEVEIYGEVEEITDEYLVIDGQLIEITSSTEIDGDPGVGDQVKVHATIDTEGNLTASEIEMLSDGDDDNSNDGGVANDNDDNSNDDNGNDNDDNGNDNDDNGNDNDDDDDSNSNDNDDNGNDNDYDDDDDNGNDNDDDDNVNDFGDDDSSDNSEDDDGNDNDSDDDDSNDNDRNDDDRNDNDRDDDDERDD